MSLARLAVDFPSYVHAFVRTAGQKWLGRCQCQPSKVLVIDNELHEYDLNERYELLKRKKRVEDDKANAGVAKAPQWLAGAEFGGESQMISRTATNDATRRSVRCHNLWTFLLNMSQVR